MIDQTYIDRKNEVIKAERRLLKELGFCVYVKHPHKVLCFLFVFDSGKLNVCSQMITMYLKVLGKEREKVLVQTAWLVFSINSAVGLDLSLLCLLIGII